MGFSNNRIAGNFGLPPSSDTKNLELVNGQPGQAVKVAQRTKSDGKGSPNPVSQNKRFQPPPIQNIKSPVSQSPQQRSSAVKTAPANIPKQYNTRFGFNNAGTKSVERSEAQTINGKKTTKGITVEFDDNSKLGGKLFWKEEFSVGTTKRSSESVLLRNASSGSFDISHEMGISADVGNGGTAMASVGVTLSKKGLNPRGSIGYQQDLGSTKVGVNVQVSGDAPMNASAEVVQKIGPTTEAAAKYIQPLGGAGSAEFRLNQDIGNGSSIQVAGDTNGGVKVGINLTQ